jgi:hypothetical protein
LGVVWGVGQVVLPNTPAVPLALRSWLSLAFSPPCGVAEVGLQETNYRTPQLHFLSWSGPLVRRGQGNNEQCHNPHCRARSVVADVSWTFAPSTSHTQGTIRNVPATVATVVNKSLARPHGGTVFGKDPATREPPHPRGWALRAGHHPLRAVHRAGPRPSQCTAKESQLDNRDPKSNHRSGG